MAGLALPGPSSSALRETGDLFPGDGSSPVMLSTTPTPDSPTIVNLTISEESIATMTAGTQTVTGEPIGKSVKTGGSWAGILMSGGSSSPSSGTGAPTGGKAIATQTQAKSTSPVASEKEVERAKASGIERGKEKTKEKEVASKEDGAVAGTRSSRGEGSGGRKGSGKDKVSNSVLVYPLFNFFLVLFPGIVFFL
jgi:hypothetical protein